MDRSIAYFKVLNAFDDMTTNSEKRILLESALRRLGDSPLFEMADIAEAMLAKPKDGPNG